MWPADVDERERRRKLFRKYRDKENMPKIGEI
jgi:hypothetical protein